MMPRRLSLRRVLRFLAILFSGVVAAAAVFVVIWASAEHMRQARWNAFVEGCKLGGTDGINCAIEADRYLSYLKEWQ